MTWNPGGNKGPKYKKLDDYVEMLIRECSSAFYVGMTRTAACAAYRLIQK